MIRKNSLLFLPLIEALAIASLCLLAFFEGADSQRRACLASRN